MQIDKVEAWQVEAGDYITLGSDTVWQVLTADDCTFVLRDEDGEDHEDNPVTLTPWEFVEIHDGFEASEIFEWEDVEVDEEVLVE